MDMKSTEVVIWTPVVPLSRTTIRYPCWGLARCGRWPRCDLVRYHQRPDRKGATNFREGWLVTEDEGLAMLAVAAEELDGGDGVYPQGIRGTAHEFAAAQDAPKVS